MNATADVLLSRRRCRLSIGQVNEIVRATKQAVFDSRKLLAANEVAFGPFLLAQSADFVTPRLTESQLQELAKQLSAAHGAPAFILKPDDPLPMIFASQTTKVQ